MARIFVTGSADGLGLALGRRLLADGHDVVLHARNQRRADDTRAAAPGASQVVVGDLATIADMLDVATQAERAGPYDAIVHNAGIGYTAPRREETVDGLEKHFAVNVLAPYLLTCLVRRPERLIYLSSGMHQGGRATLDDPQWTSRRWSGSRAYSDTKLWDVVLAFAVARHWPGVLANAVDPGWISTRMGGTGAPGSLDQGTRTQAWLAVSDDPGAKVTGRYFYDMREEQPVAATTHAALQDGLLDYCAGLTGTRLPA
ncbi:SDR family NAD(P)-dependent oxidoreductase [Actinoplanes sp. NPDC049265]|uniref:SDR family NAD(P)-dependent oxidoreductase n=1 Tax=Actinoplanes sp. NPDC049265 TaxID=3363902 RepID=UPI00371850B2